MPVRVNKRDINWAIVIIDPEDEDSKFVLDKLKEIGIKFSIVRLGPKQHGYNVELSLFAEVGDFTEFSTHLRPPIFVVEHSYFPGKAPKIRIFQGKIPISHAFV